MTYGMHGLLSGVMGFIRRVVYIGLGALVLFHPETAVNLPALAGGSLLILTDLLIVRWQRRKYNKQYDTQRGEQNVYH